MAWPANTTASAWSGSWHTLRPRNRKRVKAQAAAYSQLETPDPHDTHVVAIVEQRWMIDASYDQPSALALELDREPFVVELRLGTDPVSMMLDVDVEMRSGVRVKLSYRGRPERSFESKPAWETDHLQPLVGKISRAMEELLRA